jgi:SAM-dependent methyltransferase
VLDSHCLHCIVGDDRNKFLSNACRVLKPEGYFLVSTRCGEVTFDLGGLLFDPASRLIVTKDGIATRYVGRPENIVAEIASAGFRVMQWEVLSAKLGSGQDEMFVQGVKG